MEIEESKTSEVQNSKQETEESKADLTYTFLTSGGDKYMLTKKQIDFCSFLASKINWKTSEDIVVEMDPKDFDILYKYVAKNEITTDEMEKFDYWGFNVAFDTTVEFMKIQLRERWNRYFSQNDPKCDSKKLSDIIDNIKSYPNIVGENVISSRSRNWTISASLTQALKSGLDIKMPIGKTKLDISAFQGKVVLAGGSLISTLLCQPVSDYDLFFIGCSEAEADIIIEQLSDFLMKKGVYQFTATDKCWTFKLANYETFQFILRLYKNIDELLLGFDIDASCILYDGKQFLVSSRCENALTNHVNIVDFTRMSPTYEYRLYKYWLKGFDILIPGFEYSKINTKSFIQPHALSLFFKLSQKTGEMLIGTKKTFNPTLRNTFAKYGFLSSSPSTKAPEPLAPEKRKLGFSIRKSKRSKIRDPFIRAMLNSGIRPDQDENDDDEPVVENTDQQPNVYSRENLSNEAKATIEATCRKKDYNQSLIRRLRGIDILIFLCFQVRGDVRATISDYGAISNIDEDFRVLSCGYLSFKVLVVPNLFVQLRMNRLSGRRRSRRYRHDKTFNLNTFLEFYGFRVQWITQDPGKQVTSSFHQNVYDSNDEWFTGLFYKTKLKQEVPIPEPKSSYFLDFE